MAIKYNLTFYDPYDNLNSVIIENDNYEGEIIEIEGNCFHVGGGVQSLNQLIRGAGLTLNLLANKDQTFEEFFTDDEFSYKVTYVRNGSLVFVGWVDPQGYFESYTTETYFLQVTCVDGFVYLKNLSFVDNLGVPFTGRINGYDIIRYALAKNKLELNFNTCINTIYTGFNPASDIMLNVYFNAERFIKDDGETIMSALEALEDILEAWGATIGQYEGEWYIYKLNEMRTNPILSFFKYGPGGNTLGKVDLDASTFIRKQTEEQNTYFWVGENQEISLKKRYGAIRVNFTYGDPYSSLPNPSLTNNGTIINDYDIIEIAPGVVTPTAPEGVNLATQSETPIKEMFAMDDASLPLGQLGAVFTMGLHVAPLDPTQILKQGIRVELYDTPTGAVQYHLERQNGVLVWVNGTGGDTDFEVFQPITRYAVDLPPLPEQQYIRITINRVFNPTGGAGVCRITEITLIKKSAGLNEVEVKGESHTFTRVDLASTRIKDNIEVQIGDQALQIFNGTIFKADQVTPTTTWNRKGQVEEYPLLRCLGLDLMWLSGQNKKTIKGDVFGRFGRLALCQIEGLQGFWVCIAYSFNAATNVTSIELEQCYNQEVDINYELTFEYGDVVKPTIKG